MELAPRKIPGRGRPPKQPPSIFAPNENDSTGDDSLPGMNVYDAAVSNGKIDYQTAKTREEVALVAEKLKQAQIATEQSSIDLEKHKLELRQANGSLITKEEYLARQDSLIGAFLELTRLVVSEACLPIPGSLRSDHAAKVSLLAKSGMEAIANCVLAKSNHDQINYAILQVFTTNE